MSKRTVHHHWLLVRSLGQNDIMAPLTTANLLVVSRDLCLSLDHDDLLFDAQVNTGFTGLLHLGEMTWLNKVTMCFSLEFFAWEYSFWLPTHKADTTFKGNQIVVRQVSGAPDPLPVMKCYIDSRDARFPFHPQLWLKADRTIPLCSWFINRLQHYFGPNIAGQSMRAGGATAMAEAGAVPELIKGAGCWSSKSFERYICKNPVVLHALILSRSSHYDRTWTIFLCPFATVLRVHHHHMLIYLTRNTYQKKTLPSSLPPLFSLIAFSHASVQFQELPRLPSRGAAYRLTWDVSKLN